jgi:light-regulated signal transduction histidine kinase (bacteriophytochrome)
MRNMNTAASLTVGLAHRQRLWGMLAVIIQRHGPRDLSCGRSPT